MVEFIFSVLDRKYSFWPNLIQKIKIVRKFSTFIYSNMQNSVVMFTFSVFDWKYSFWANLVKIVNLHWNMAPVLDLTLQVLSKKSIWHFDAMWLNFKQFTRGDLKLVVILVLLKKTITRHVTLDQLSNFLTFLVRKHKINQKRFNNCDFTFKSVLQLAHKK